MKVYGLKSDEIQKIKKLLQDHFGDLSDAKAYLFGSRATGKHKPFSDIDIAVKSKSKELNKKIALFNESWEKSNLPYKIDITSWEDLFKPYLPQIRKQKIPFWEPKDEIIHPWRTCPYGQHWRIRHNRLSKNKKMEDVDGTCCKNPSRKDILYGNEIQKISTSLSFLSAKNKVCPYQGPEKLSAPDQYDSLINGL